MRAAFYESIGPARDVLRVEKVKTPEPGPGEVRVPTFPLAEVAAAHEAVERGTIGNVIVKVM